MRAVMTKAKGQMEVVDVPEPEPPGPGEVVVRPEGERVGSILDIQGFRTTSA